MIDPQLDLSPADRHNLELVANVHPSDWTNPTPEGRSPWWPGSLLVWSWGYCRALAAQPVWRSCFRLSSGWNQALRWP